MLHQKHTLWNVFLPRTQRVRCSMTIGSCSIWQMKPYPRIFLVMQAMTISWPMALIKKVMTVALALPMCGRLAL
jgi:hypothetical protein